MFSYYLAIFIRFLSGSSPEWASPGEVDVFLKLTALDPNRTKQTNLGPVRLSFISWVWEGLGLTQAIHNMAND